MRFKTTVLVLITAILQVSASTYAQKITLSEKNAPLVKVFDKISAQSGYDFFVSNSLLKDARRVNIEVRDAEFLEVLERIFEGQPLEYRVEDKAVIVRKKEVSLVEKMVNALKPPLDISGTVVDEKGNAMAGVAIKVKGTKVGTTTDNNGKFYMTNVDDKAVVEFHFLGYKNREVPANGSFNTIALEVSPAELQEVVVAYGKTTQQALTGAVTVVKGEQIQNLPNRSFDKSLQGLVPGLQITQGSGQPGSGTATFILRGVATGGDPENGSTVRNPLIVIDGVPISQDPMQSRSASAPPISNPLAQLNPTDIETITVLKDASAIALYGSKASKGVILVTTKKGKVGKAKVTFSQQTDFSSRLKSNIANLNQAQYLELVYESYKNGNPAITDAQINTDLLNKFPNYKNADNQSVFYPASDWLSELYNDRASNNTTQLAFSGGSDKSNFYFNLENTNQNGIVKKTGYDRQSIRFNFESRPVDWFKVGFRNTFSYNVQDYAAVTDGAPISTPVIISPLNTVRKEDGSYYLNYGFGLGASGGTDFVPNPAAAAEYNLKRNTSFRGLSSINAELKLLKVITITSIVGADYTNTEAKEKTDPRLAETDFVAAPGLGRIFQRDMRNVSLINTNTISFNKTLADHKVSLLAGQEAQIAENNFVEVEKSGFALNPGNTDLTGAGTNVRSAGLKSKQTLLSYFSQLNYSYLDRYHLSGSIRTDGSSRFGTENRFGTYWSLGAGWVISQEPLLRNTSKWLDFLKLRGSLGPAGNSSAILYQYRTDPLSTFGFLGNLAFAPNTGATPGNPEIRWEQTFTWDAGIEMRFLKDRFAFSIDMYQRTTKDFIDRINLPLASGIQNVFANFGDISNKGVEISLAADVIRTSNFNWRLTANLSRNRNVITKAFTPVTIQSQILAKAEGYEYNSYYMPVWLGVDPGTGLPQWKDNNGQPTSNYNAAKREFVGSPQPKAFGALTNTVSWKGISLSAMLYYKVGYQAYNQANVFLMNDGTNVYLNQTIEALNGWTKPGDIAANPKRAFNSSANASTNGSTRYLFDGDFIRLSNVNLSYNLPKRLLAKTHLSHVAIFVQGQNLALWTKYPGLDPESVDAFGVGEFPYPLQKNYSIGLNASF